MASFDEYELLEQQVDPSTKEKPADDSKRESSRSKSHKHSSRDKHRSKDRDREKDKERDRDRNGHKSRSRRDSSRDRRRRSRSRSRDKRVSGGDRRVREDSFREPIRRRPVSPIPPRREPTPPEVKEQRERERELMELDRDTRTIFAYNLPLRATEKELFQFFSSAGKIGDVRIIVDRNTRKSKGFAYIEYVNREDIVKAMGLTGQLLMGQAVMVKSAEAEKNLAWEAAQQQAASAAQLNSIQSAGQGPCKLLVSNLHSKIADGDLRQIFEPFGAVESVSIQQDGRAPTNYAFVQYTSAADAAKAMQQLDQMDIAGHKLGVKIAPMSAGETAQLAAAAARVDLDDEDDGGGMRLNSTARAALMNRLAGAAGAPAPAPQVSMPMQNSGPLPGPPPQTGPTLSPAVQTLALEQGVLGPASPRPTPCLLLKNMFDPTQETTPDWDKEIAEDVKEECGKFGAVNHIYVDRNSKGFVYLKFAGIEGSQAAQKALHGRWFAGNQVLAEFQFAPTYSDYFRCP